MTYSRSVAVIAKHEKPYWHVISRRNDEKSALNQGPVDHYLLLIAAIRTTLTDTYFPFTLTNKKCGYMPVSL